jgi:hypothetical protein
MDFFLFNFLAGVPPTDFRFGCDAFFEDAGAAPFEAGSVTIVLISF